MPGVNVVIDDASLQNLNEVETKLRNAGLVITNVLPQSGVIVGEADERDIPRLREVTGVVDIELDRVIDIGPPDLDVQ